MSRRSLALLIAVTMSTPLLLAQTPVRPATQTGAAAAPAAPDVLYRRATEAWEAGAYPDALAALLPLMKGPAAAEYLDRVAVLTGELFTTTELTTDGRNPKISPSGQYASYEMGPATDATTRVVSLGAAPKTVIDLKGTGLAFDDGHRAVLIDATGALVLVDLSTGTQKPLATGTLQKASPMFGSRGAVLFVGVDPADATRNDIYQASETGAPVRLTDEPGFKANPIADPTGAALVYTVAAASPIRGGGPGARGAGGAAGAAGGGRAGGGGRGATPAPPATFAVVNLAAKTTRVIEGSAVTMSANGKTIAWLSRGTDGSYTLSTQPTLGDKATVARTGRERINAPALSPDGTHVAYEYMAATDWEIYITDQAGTHRRVTRDIQHDILPRFLTNTTLLGMMGEPRHRRSQVYDLTAGTRTRLFANNTVRTISPEYIWLPSADGQKLVLSAERDGDTVSTERGVYVLDLSKKVTTADVVSRIERQAATENELRARMTKTFAPLADQIKRIMAKASVSRVHEYEKTLYDFDSKYVSQPGNNKAVEYLTKTYESFGYKPEQQWFSPAQAQGGRTANVVSIKRGTENPDLIYVVSSHYDSVVVGPGADDDTSGTAALLEAARLLSDVPLPATVVFASFTGEEAGLLGSREFVRLAAERKWNVVGALNNDMIGWGAESSRMDNTIRYSNAGIRDIQHGAAFLFTNLILYDAKYYKGTDANAFYDGWGDIVGGIGSYPVLANPNYHQPTDFIETMNFRQIMETGKVTAATLTYLASSPSRLKDLKVERKNAAVELTWTPSPEKGVKNYVVAYGPATDPLRTKLTVLGPKATLPALPAGTQVAVKAVNARGLEGWDWARGEVR
jgi:hypothetical protein